MYLTNHTVQKLDRNLIWSVYLFTWKYNCTEVFFLKHATVDYAELKRIWDDKVGLTRLLLHTKEFPRATVGTRASIE